MIDTRNGNDTPTLHELEMVECFRVERFFEELCCVVFGKPEITWYEELWGTS